MIFGKPKCDIHVVKKNLATVSAMMFSIGSPSGHLEKRSIKVKQYLNPREGGSGPMMSKWTWSKRAFGIENLSGARRLCRVTFDR